MSYTELLLIEIRDRSYGQQQTPAAGCRPASDQAPLRQAMSTTCRIVPATLPQRGTRRTPLKTSVSISETLFLVPSSSGWPRGGATGVGSGQGSRAVRSQARREARYVMIVSSFGRRPKPLTIMKPPLSGLGHPGAVAGAGGLLPDGAGAGLEASGPVELALVQEA